MYLLNLVRKLVQDWIRNLTGWSYMIVPSSSMEPTLFPGDIIFASDRIYSEWDTKGWQDPGNIVCFADQYEREGKRFYGRGQVVVFRDSEDVYNYMVKRVVAVEGDVVSARKRTLYVNGVGQEERYTKEPLNYVLPDIPIGPGEVFVLGDNRNNSDDCHFLYHGIEASRIVGEVRKVWKTRYLLGWIFSKESS